MELLLTSMSWLNELEASKKLRKKRIGKCKASFSCHSSFSLKIRSYPTPLTLMAEVHVVLFWVKHFVSGLLLGHQQPHVIVLTI
jgi:hypothetical protein